MRTRLWILAFGCLSCGVLILGALNLAPSPPNRQPAEVKPAMSAIPAKLSGDTSEMPATIVRTLSSETLARMFYRPAKKKSVPPAPTQAAAPKTQRATWLQYLGFSEREGARTYLLKDTRSNRIIRLREGERNSEWILLTKDAEGLVVRSGSSSYFVPVDH